MRVALHRRAAATGLTLAVFASSTVARADDPTAERLYEEGRQAAETKDWATACDRFQRSQQIEPAPGTLLNLANCEENRGRLLDARAHFERAAQLFRPGDERIAYARTRATAVEPRLARVVVRLDASAPPGTSVDLDGTALGEQALGRVTVVDPGEHVLSITTPGRAPIRSSLRLAEGESREVQLGAAGPSIQPAPAAAASTSGVAPSPAPNAPTHGDVSASATNPLRTGGYVGIGIGAAGLLLGTVAGIVTWHAKDTVDHHCQSDCDATGLSAESTGKTWSTVSTVAFIAGGLAAVGGVSLLLLEPSHQSAVTAQASSTIAALSFRTSF